MSAPIDAHEIREALEAHARFDDTAALARLGSVKARVRVVRRRRRAALAGAAAAVVAVAGGVATLLPGEREVGPSDRTFGDLTAPATMTSLGYTFEFSMMIAGEAAVGFAPEGDEPHLISWAGRSDRAVELTGLEETPFASADDFEDFAVLPGGGDPEVKATGSGELALAVYTLKDRPAGETVDGITFREDRAGDRLIESVIGEAGDNDLTFTFTMPEGPVREVTYCSGVSRAYDLRVSLNGQFTSGGGCADAPHYDGQFGSTTWDQGIEWPDGTKVEPGDEVTARIWLTRHEKSDSDREAPVAESDTVRLGIAFYEAAPSVAEVVGWQLPEFYEFGGHTWRYVASEEVRLRGGRAAYRIGTEDGPVQLLRVATRTTDEDGTEASYRVWGGPTDGRHTGGSFMTEVGPFRKGAETVNVRRRGGGGDGESVGFAIYERVD